MANRTDGRDLMLEMGKRGYDVIRKRDDLLAIPAWQAPRVFGVFRNGSLDFADVRERDGSQPSLADLVREGIASSNTIQKATSSCGRRSHRPGRAEQRRRADPRARSGARPRRQRGPQYAGDKALIIVTGKQSVGGLRMNGYPFKNDRGMSVIGMNPQGMHRSPGHGAGGSPPQMRPLRINPESPPSPHGRCRRRSGWLRTDFREHGAGSEKLQGSKDNTDIFQDDRREFVEKDARDRPRLYDSSVSAPPAVKTHRLHEGACARPGVPATPAPRMPPVEASRWRRLPSEALDVCAVLANPPRFVEWRARG